MPASFDDACALIDSALHGRREILADVAQSSDSRKSLLRLRERMRTHAWKAGPRLIDLHHIVTTCDTLTRKDGFHAIHDWDGVAEKVNADIIPLDVLDYLLDRRGEGPASRTVLAILVDYYFLYLLALLSLRIWDEGGADDHLDRLDQLLRELQGPNGSGQLFADDAATLMLIATSHYELDDRAYDALLDRVRTLNHSHRLELALVHAAGMGCHLRFGFEATYGRDMVAMREDNGTDYPWLCFRSRR